MSGRISYLNNKQPNLIREQIRLALGDRLHYRQSDISFRGASIEFRIVAEDTGPWFRAVDWYHFPIRFS